MLENLGSLGLACEALDEVFFVLVIFFPVASAALTEIV